MKNIILFLILIVPISLFAQQITEYEYWNDDDFTKR